MIKITIETFEWDKDENGKSNYNLSPVHRAHALELTFDDSNHVNKEEAANIVRSVLFPGWLNTPPIMLPSPNFDEPLASDTGRVWRYKATSYGNLKDEIIKLRDEALGNEQLQKATNGRPGAEEYYRGGTEYLNRVLNELLP